MWMIFSVLFVFQLFDFLMVVYFASQYKEKTIELLRSFWEKFAKLLKEYKIEHILVIGDDVHKLEDISISARRLTEHGYYDYILFQTTGTKGLEGEQYRTVEVHLGLNNTYLFVFTNEEWYEYKICLLYTSPSPRD